MVNRIVTNRFGQRTFDGPPRIQSTTQCSAIYASCSYPFTDNVRFVHERNLPTPSRIRLLLKGSGPFAILLGIALVIGDAMDAIFRPWFRPHVFKKTLKGGFPALAHCDASAPVISVRRRVGVAAPSFNPCPGMILASGACFAGGMAMLQWSWAKATTTTRRFASQMICLHKFFCATVTSAMPNDSAHPLSSIGKNKPAPEAPSSMVLISRSFCGRIERSHDSFPFKRVAARAA